MKHVEILGVRLSRLSMDEAQETCLERIRSGQGGYACFVNVHSLTESTKDSALRDALNAAAFSFADGLPLVWVSRALGEAVGSRVCGPDFTEKMLAGHPELAQGWVGGAPGQAETIAARFGLKQATFYSPPRRSFSPEHAREDWEEFQRRCPHGKAPSLVWVGLGAPKQELWMRVVSPMAQGTMFFGVGAAFDFLSGTKPRAPRWMQASGLEWLHRLASEPTRLGPRYFGTNLKFTALAASEVVFHRNRHRNGEIS